jgi:hypothetical protein
MRLADMVIAKKWPSKNGLHEYQSLSPSQTH